MKTYRTGFFAGIDWKRRARGISRCPCGFLSRTAKPTGDARTKPSNSLAQRFDRPLPPPPASTEVSLVPSTNLAATAAEHRGEKRRGQTKIGGGRDSHHGSVAVDERRLAYVQVRFQGYIQRVFADATYQYVHTGQPLFTIYSPDLVATEREYLVASRISNRWHRAR